MIGVTPFLRSVWWTVLAAPLALGCSDVPSEPTPAPTSSTGTGSATAALSAPTPPPTVLEEWKGLPTAIAVGKDTSCAITEKGGVRCWGDSAHANLIADYSKLPAPTRLAPVGVRGIKGAEQLDVSYEHGCARAAETLYCFLITSLVAEEITGLPPVPSFSTYRAGTFVASTTDDVLRIWRPGARKPQTEPQGKLPGLTSISARHRHGCAVGDGGTLRCYGTDKNGKLKRGAAPIPRGSGRATSVSAGFGFSCVVTEDAKVSCWGRNQRGQLGIDPKNPKDLEGKDVVDTGRLIKGLTDVTAVAAGGAFACALGKDEKVRCWGENRWGQLGDGTFERRSDPKEVVGLEAVRQLSVGESHGCALTNESKVVCWGRNDRGQLGDRTTKDRAKPAAVAW